MTAIPNSTAPVIAPGTNQAPSILKDIASSQASGVHSNAPAASFLQLVAELKQVAQNAALPVAVAIPPNGTGKAAVQRNAPLQRAVVTTLVLSNSNEWKTSQPVSAADTPQQPAAQTSQQQVSQQSVEQPAQPAAQPAVQQPYHQAGQQPAQQPAQPAVQQSQHQVQKRSVQQPAQAAAQQSQRRVQQEPVQQPPQATVQQSQSQVQERLVQQPAQAAVQQSQGQVQERPVQQPPQATLQQSQGQVQERPVQQPAQAAVQQSQRQSQRRVQRRVQQWPVQQPAQTAVRQHPALPVQVLSEEKPAPAKAEVEKVDPNRGKSSQDTSGDAENRRDSNTPPSASPTAQVQQKSQQVPVPVAVAASPAPDLTSTPPLSAASVATVPPPMPPPVPPPMQPPMQHSRQAPVQSSAQLFAQAPTQASDQSSALGSAQKREHELDPSDPHAFPQPPAQASDRSSVFVSPQDSAQPSVQSWNVAARPQEDSISEKSIWRNNSDPSEKLEAHLDTVLPTNAQAAAPPIKDDTAPPRGARQRGTDGSDASPAIASGSPASAPTQPAVLRESSPAPVSYPNVTGNAAARYAAADSQPAPVNQRAAAQPSVVSAASKSVSLPSPSFQRPTTPAVTGSPQPVPPAPVASAASSTLFLSNPSELKTSQPLSDGTNARQQPAMRQDQSQVPQWPVQQPAQPTAQQHPAVPAQAWSEEAPASAKNEVSKADQDQNKPSQDNSGGAENQHDSNAPASASPAGQQTQQNSEKVVVPVMASGTLVPDVTSTPPQAAAKVVTVQPSVRSSGQTPAQSSERLAAQAPTQAPHQASPLVSAQAPTRVSGHSAVFAIPQSSAQPSVASWNAVTKPQAEPASVKSPRRNDSEPPERFEGPPATELPTNSRLAVPPIKDDAPSRDARHGGTDGSAASPAVTSGSASTPAQPAAPERSKGSPAPASSPNLAGNPPAHHAAADSHVTPVNQNAAGQPAVPSPATPSVLPSASPFQQPTASAVTGSPQPAPPPPIASAASAASAPPTTVASTQDAAPPSMVENARLVRTAGRTEMHIGLNSDALGSVDMHAVMRNDASGATSVGASITVQDHTTHALLMKELPALQSHLEERNIHVGEITVIPESLSAGSGMQQNGGSPQESHARQPRFPYAAPDSSAKTKDDPAPDSTAPSSWAAGSGRLSVMA
jgi:hypothetical protein